jgi:hypothetical protein
MFKDDIHQGTPGLVIGHRGGPDVRTYGVRFTLDRGRTAVVDDLTDHDILDYEGKPMRGTLPVGRPY